MEIPQRPLILITDDDGVLEQELSYDAWGNLRDPDTWCVDATIQPMLDRGYTGHEHLPNFNLINMNGRMYDPVIGRMLSPDIAIQDEYNPQAYNRYTYCFNNPLRFTDPSGYFVEDDWYVDKYGRVIWDDNVTNVTNTPDGGTYIGPNNKDILKYYGLRETYEKISMTRWGFSLNGVSMEYDHNGKPYPNQRPWLFPIIPADQVEGYLRTSVNVSYNTDEASGTNKQERVFEGITFDFHFAQSSRSMDFKGVAKLQYADRIKENYLESPSVLEQRIGIEGHKYSILSIRVSAKDIGSESTFIKAMISAAAVDRNMLIQPRPVEMIWDLYKPKTIPNQFTFKYYFLYEK